MTDSMVSTSEDDGRISRRQAIFGALALAAGSLIVTRPEVALANVGDTVHVGDDLYGKQTSFQVSTTGTATGTAIASSFIGRNANGPEPFPVQGLGSIIWSAAPAGSAAVWGDGTALNNYGVHAVHDLAAGVALKVQGKAAFSRSGKATIAKGKSSKTVTGLAAVGTDALILVTLQGSAGSGNYVRYAKRLNSSSFQVVLAKGASSTVSFAWFIIN